MRKLWLLFLLVPFIALWTYGCEETSNPLETDSQQRAEASTPTYAKGGVDKPPASGIVRYVTVQSEPVTGWHSPAFSEVTCPLGKVPINGGYEIEPFPGENWPSSSFLQSYEVIANRPTHQVEADGTVTGGWRVGIRGTAYNGSVRYQFYTWAGCVSAQ